MAKQRNRRQAQYCANTAMPEDLTEQFRERLAQFGSCQKAQHLKSEIFSKFISADTDPAALRQERAIAKWLSTEVGNESTEYRLLTTAEDFQILPSCEHDGNPSRYVTYSRFVSFCQDLIREIIGDTAPIDALIGSFSGGASTSRARTESHPASKYLGVAHVTPACRSLFEELVFPELPLWAGFEGMTLKEVPGNVLFTVPKKTDIDRCACKEPDINMFVQKGIGNYFRDALRNIGINLNDQSINRSLAQVGARDGSLATLDLSSASDSVTRSLVELLLPECWFTLLDSVRSPVTILPDGTEHRNSMFSSMGNGYTFELESLLFYAIARATAYFTGTRGIISIYGDDIIVPTAIAEDLSWALFWFGFKVNPEKSFWNGPFRESCGGHYYNGADITPFYVKAPLETLVDVIDVANKLRQWAAIELPYEYGILNPLVEDTWLWLKSFVPSCLWGGSDTSFKYQLVSYDTPEKRLMEETKSRDTGPGGYLHWHNAAWARTIPTDDGIETSKLSISRKRFRQRRVRVTAVPRLLHHWVHEVQG